VTKNKDDDRILPVADIRRMEPPRSDEKGEAFIHFSGFSVKLIGTGLRRVLHRIYMRRCSSLHEYTPGKTTVPGEPFIEWMEFRDVAPPKPKEPDPSTSH
jgi:hypothetical protein